jgi:type II secretory pathway pseudopilin PulG
MIAKVFMRKARKAVSLVEIAMGLSIIAVVAAGAMFYFNNANVSSRANEAMQQISALQEIVRTMYQSEGSYANVTTAAVSQSALLAARYKGPSNTIRSPFGSTVTMGPATSGTTFEITMNNVPATACQRLSTIDLGSGLQQITVGSTTVTGGAGLTAAQANAACDGPTTIVWRFI